MAVPKVWGKSPSNSISGIENLNPPPHRCPTPCAKFEGSGVSTAHIPFRCPNPSSSRFRRLDTCLGHFSVACKNVPIHLPRLELPHLLRYGRTFHPRSPNRFPRSPMPLPPMIQPGKTPSSSPATWEPNALAFSAPTTPSPSNQKKPTAAPNRSEIEQIKRSYRFQNSLCHRPCSDSFTPSTSTSTALFGVRRPKAGRGQKRSSGPTSRPSMPFLIWLLLGIRENFKN